MKSILVILLVLFVGYANAQIEMLLKDSIRIQKEKIGTQSLLEYVAFHPENSEPSQSNGIVSNGSLTNGKLMPFSGSNYQYFDSISYMSSRAFVNDQVRSTVLAAYGFLASDYPTRQFYFMECSREHGGEIFPHKTHQNGLSVDFMMPLLKDAKEYYGLDTLGADHYWLSFDNDGKYSKDKSIIIDFETVAKHILRLNEAASKFNLKVSKVIIKVELKDELYAGNFGKKLKESGIYVVRKLSPIINSLHDDHFHVDFEKL